MSSGREYSGFTLFLLIILLVVPLYVVAQNKTSSAQPGTTIGGLQLRSTSVDMAGLGRNGISLSLKAVVYNSNSFGATLESANYSVYANSRYMGSGQLADAYNIAPQSSQTLVFPVNIGWGSAFRTTGAYLVDLGNVTWKANGTASIEVGGFPLIVPFEFQTG
jgi:LEA14-like dessication related protein